LVRFFRHTALRRTTRLRGCLSLALFLLLLLSACQENPTSSAQRTAIAITLQVDGEARQVMTRAGNVRELLEAEGVVLDPADEVIPPLFTVLTEPTTISVVRIRQEIQLVEQSVSFERKIVRNESMNADDPPLIIQGGRPGLEERTVRLVFRDGIEVERQTIGVNVVVEPQDEIVMIGIGAAPGNVLFAGTMAFISSGRALILRGSSAFPEQLALNGVPDGRAFALSPTGELLLYTRAESEGGFNSLWVIGTQPGAEAISLGVENVLWADWNPSAVRTPEIAYTTALPTELAPGWEANNDLWLGTVATAAPGDSPDQLFTTTQIVEAYPAKLGWWGGNYAWSPTGRYLAYAHADEVGIIDARSETVPAPRTRLHTFVEFDTLSDWVWVPTLSWSPEGAYLAFTSHRGPATQDGNFDTWAVAVDGSVAAPFMPQTGIWAHVHWAPGGATEIGAPIAFLRATEPIDSLRSSYTLWTMDRDGSNSRQLYPLPGETSRFPREAHFMTWGPTGEDIAFVFNDSLYLYNLATGDPFRITQDEGNLSHPSWAPYGAGIGRTLPTTEVVPVEELAPAEERLFDESQIPPAE
jgi:hypothetical protein